MYLNIFTVNGLKQVPKCLDFHVTPVLTFTNAPTKELEYVNKGFTLAIEWGYWAVGVSIFNLK